MHFGLSTAKVYRSMPNIGLKKLPSVFRVLRVLMGNLCLMSWPCLRWCQSARSIDWNNFFSFGKEKKDFNKAVHSDGRLECVV